MTERISSSLAVSVATHAVVIVIAGFLLSPISKIEILPAPTTSFVLIESEARKDQISAINNESQPLISLPPIPKPVIAQTITEHTSEGVSLTPVPANKPSVVRPKTPKPVVGNQSRMSFDDYQAVHTKRPTPENKIVTHITPPRFHETKPTTLSSNASTSRTTFENDAQLRSFNAELIQRLRDAYLPVGAEDSALSCRIEFVLASAGRIASVKILKSSGNPVFDNAVLEAVGRVRVSTPPQAFIGVPLTTIFQVAQ